MMIQSKTSSRPFESRADLIGLDDTDHTASEREIFEEDPAQVYCPSQEHITRMCRMIRSDWSEKEYIKRSGYKPVRWLVSIVSVDPDITFTLDE
ncbi:MAG TPA: hypothetical protein VLA12_06100 [Planctomycetaceae bacterium]|nr:hypothetical protein [Planctomycetaceae bacterium]